MPKGASAEMVGQHLDLICSENQHMELEEMVNLSKPNPPKETDNPQTLLGFSQIYDPKYEVSDATNDGVHSPTATYKKMQTTTEAITKKETLMELSDTLHP